MKSTNPSSGVELLERSQGAFGRVDRENRVIRGVKILGLKSANPGSVLGSQFAGARGYEYSPAAVRAAIPLYEGVKVNLNHVAHQKTSEGRVQTSQHRVQDRFGRLINVRYEDQSGLVGDLQYLASHPHAEMILEMAERMPDTIWLSHHAFGDPVRQADGRVVIQKINRVASVDLIGTSPGTTKSLFEDGSMNPESETEEADDTADNANADDDCDPGPDSLETVLQDAFKASVFVVIDDSSLTLPEKLVKIKAILRSQEKATAQLTEQVQLPAARGRIVAKMKTRRDSQPAPAYSGDPFGRRRPNIFEKRERNIFESLRRDRSDKSMDFGDLRIDFGRRLP